ncbi:hypothetical protein ESZ36_10525 [Colwellia demingiae]|uniref:Uncharacterized protein n=1 Tax=Colwellia demingiae TaxID=89401 RepID=A0A5C6QGM2_9GAMM|nr:hypothetical protein [Colwellia demingiae]TWX67747.1 hypothetical protein ESZ36_10525 [Colwellia demingiae]
MDKYQEIAEINKLGSLSYALISTAMVMLLLQVGLVNVNYNISGDSIMRLYLPVMVLLAGIWVPTLKVRRFIKRHKDYHE